MTPADVMGDTAATLISGRRLLSYVATLTPTFLGARSEGHCSAR